MKKLLLGVSGAVSFLVFLVLGLVSNHMIDCQLDQQMAERWSEKKDVAQVSCFFSSDAAIKEDMFKEFEHALDAALKEASITLESENPGARLYVDAYSADGKITLTNGKTNLTADAIGIGGDFFLFHPLKLINGSFFSGNDLMQDHCVIDQDAAWQLFGSNDVVGQTVYIGKVPHMITGVVERQQGRMAESAGLDSTVVYVSYKTLSELGSNHGINHYEIIMPSPVTGYAYNYVKDNIRVDEKEVDVIDNTSRYSLLSRLKMIGQFGTRSMNGKAIIYPYWENIARGYEDVIAVFTLFMILFLLYPVILLVVIFVHWWRHKGWTLKDVWNRMKDKLERSMERWREKKQNQKLKQKENDL